MTPAMTQAEGRLLNDVLRSCQHYVEFGAGGSTALASRLVGKSIVAVDSSEAWMKRVEDYCRLHGRVQPTLSCVDIGPIKEWGFPTDSTLKARWPDYHSEIWKLEGADCADTYMVDGRFRVACFMQILLRAKTNPLLLIHDFSKRKQYHCILPFVELMRSEEELFVFRRKATFDENSANILLEQHRCDPE